MSQKRPSSSTGKGKSPARAQRPALLDSLAANAETIALIVLVIGGLLTIDLATEAENTTALMHRLFGWGAVPVLLALLLGALAFLTGQGTRRLGLLRDLPWQPVAESLGGLAFLLLAALGLTHLWSDFPDPWQAALQGQGGGVVGWLLGALPNLLLGNLLSSLLLLVLAALGLWLAARPLGLPAINWQAVAPFFRELPGRLLPGQPGQEQIPGPGSSSRARKEASGRSEGPDPQLPSIVEMEPPPKPRRKRPPRTTPSTSPIKSGPRPDYLPPLDLLKGEHSQPSLEADNQYKKSVIEHTLASFNVPVEVVDINVGPTVTQFGVKPGYLLRRGVDGQTIRRRVRVNRIKALTNDLALALEAPTLRIEAPVPGKGYVGIEVPNSDSSLVSLRAVLESHSFLRLKSPLAFALGRDVSGEPLAADLSVMPHLLVAGATGSGKTVCLNAIIASLLFNSGPDRLRLLLVDPKQVELTVYNGVPHLLAPVVTEADQVVGALTWLTLQMDDRYRAFAQVGARHLKDYNHKVGRKRKPAQWRDLEPFPNLVLVIDELADLMMANPEAVEHSLCRLAQMARATGIHLVVATQRPSVDVITGLIKANFPARIAFSVTSQTDSRVILDTPGADKLLGQGDMLFMRPDSSKLSRVQGCFISDREIEGLVRFWRDSMPAEELSPNAPRYPWTGLMAQLEDRDDLYERALDLLQGQERVSTSWLQRRLRVGYNRAAELIGRMELDGYVGPDEGAGRGREVLLADEEDEEDLF